MGQNNINKQDNDNQLLEYNNQNNPRIKINRHNINNENQYLESPKKFADKVKNENTTHYIQMIKNKLRDDVSDFNNLDTEQVQEESRKEVKSSSKLQKSKKKKFPKNFNNLIQNEAESI